MEKIDEATLVAYADGELDVQTTRALDEQLALRPDLAARVAGYRQDAALLKAAFQPVLHEPFAPEPFRRRAESAAPHGDSPGRPASSTRPMLGWAVAAALGAMMVGGYVGHDLAHQGQISALQQLGVATPGDHQILDRALSVSLESSVSGTATPWRNPDTGHGGDVMPVRTFKTKNGQFCREFLEKSTLFGTNRESGGVACRRDDGVWKVRVRYFPDA